MRYKSDSDQIDTLHGRVTGTPSRAAALLSTQGRCLSLHPRYCSAQLGSVAHFDNEALPRVSFTASPYGQEASFHHAGTGQTGFEFTGKKRDKETNMFYFHDRPLLVGVPHFPQPDRGPWIYTNVKTLNRYQYGYQNPSRYVDPDGRIPWDVLDVAVFTASAYDAWVSPTPKNLGFLALDTVALLPLVPSVGYVRHGSKIRQLTRWGEFGEFSSHMSAYGTYANSFYSSYMGEQSWARFGVSSALFFTPRLAQSSFTVGAFPKLSKLSRTSAFDSLWNAGSYAVNKAADSGLKITLPDLPSFDSWIYGGDYGTTGTN